MVDNSSDGPKDLPKMSTPTRKRLSAEARKAAIAKAALPLFASCGYDGVSTRDLAEASGVSEALLFRYYPSKRALFDDIRRLHGESRQAESRKVAELEATTENLVRLVVLFVHGIVMVDAIKAAPVMKLYYRSFLDGDDFARSFLRSPYLKTLATRFEACLEAARSSGHASVLPTPTHDLFWFVQHVASAACLMRLRKPAVIKYKTSESDIVRAMSIVALRGIGLSERAIEAHASPDALKGWLLESKLTG